MHELHRLRSKRLELKQVYILFQDRRFFLKEMEPLDTPFFIENKRMIFLYYYFKVLVFFMSTSGFIFKKNEEIILHKHCSDRKLNARGPLQKNCRQVNSSDLPILSQEVALLTLLFYRLSSCARNVSPTCEL